MNTVQSKEERTYAMLCHATAFLGLLYPLIGNVLGPLIVWILKKDEYPLVDDQGKESLNFQLSLIIYGLILCVTCIGVLLIPLLGVFDLIMLVIATVKTYNGEPFRYPLTIRLIK